MTPPSDTPAWMVEARCIDMPNAWWYPIRATDIRTNAKSDEHYDSARRICNGCPVREECGAHAIEHDERWGMWGGLTPGQRARRTPPRQPQPIIRWCGVCRARFEAQTRNTKYCSGRCKNSAARHRYMGRKARLT